MNRRVLLFGLAAALAVVGLWYLLLWKPRAEALADAHQQADQAEQQTAALRTKLRQKKAAKQDERRKRTQIDGLGEAIPDEPELAEFILAANRAARDSGVELVTVTPSPPAVAATTAPAPSPAPTTTPTTTPARASTSSATTTPALALAQPSVIQVSLSVRGAEPNLLAYLRRLNKLPRIVVVDSLNLASAGTAEGATELTAQITAKMFAQGAQAAQAPASQAPPTTPVSSGGSPAPASSSEAPPPPASPEVQPT